MDQFAINNTDIRARYDTETKMLFSHKMPLAYIIQAIVPQFAGMSLNEIEPYIDSLIYVESQPMYEGALVRNPKIGELPAEREIHHNGKVNYDILFRVSLPNTNGEYIYINIEIPNKFNPGYYFSNKAVLYAGNLFSKRLEYGCADNDYDKLKSVYSISIFINCPKEAQNSTIRMHLTQETSNGEYAELLQEDLLNLVFVHLGDSKTHKDGSPLEQMLYTLLTDDIMPEDKIRILRNTYHLTVNHELEETILRKNYWADTLYTNEVQNV